MKGSVEKLSFYDSVLEAAQFGRKKGCHGFEIGQRTINDKSKLRFGQGFLEKNQVETVIDKLKVEAKDRFINGEYFQAQEKYQEAIELIADAGLEERLRKKLSSLYSNLALVHLKLEEYTKSLDLVEKALGVSPFSVLTIGRKTQTLIKLGRKYEACSFIEKKINCSKSSDSKRSLTDIYRKLMPEQCYNFGLPLLTKTKSESENIASENPVELLRPKTHARIQKKSNSMTSTKVDGVGSGCSVAEVELLLEKAGEVLVEQMKQNPVLCNYISDDRLLAVVKRLGTGSSQDVERIHLEYSHDSEFLPVVKELVLFLRRQKPASSKDVKFKA